MFWEEIKKIFFASGSHQVYWRLHAIGILILYEIIIHIGLSPQAMANLREADSWFAFFIDGFGWFGTMLVSIGVGIAIFIPAWQDLKGIKNPKEKKDDKKISDEWEKANGGKDLMKAANIPKYKAPDKKPFKPNSWVLARLAFEGFTFGALAFVLLRYPAFYFTGQLTDWNFSLPSSEMLEHLNIGWWHYLALALGTGLYLELLFRKWLFDTIFKWIENFLKKKPSKGAGGLLTWAVSFIPSKTIKWGKKTVKLFRQMVTAVIISLLYSIIHMLILDSPEVYKMVYFYMFSMALCSLYIWRGLSVAIWCHIWYNLFYFMLV